MNPHSLPPLRYSQLRQGTQAPPSPHFRMRMPDHKDFLPPRPPSPFPPIPTRAQTSPLRPRPVTILEDSPPIFSDFATAPPPQQQLKRYSLPIALHIQPANDLEYMDESKRDFMQEDSYEVSMEPSPQAQQEKAKETDISPDTPKNGRGQLTLRPLGWRGWQGGLWIIMRLIGLFGSASAFGFLLGASPASGEEVPFDNPIIIYVVYVASILSIVYILVSFPLRLKGHDQSNPVSIATFVLDLAIGILWFLLGFILIAKYPCPADTYSQWCKFYHAHVFFIFLTTLSYFVIAINHLRIISLDF
ncbi:uncharacterized protein VTP21DRAFT_8589 [Calcarisporiella thermophila]|uniref:uncharacterized protein n=1 Tax=Calcarisporiella thermophila TaxID=911321 RepID=UPI0037431A3F